MAKIKSQGTGSPVRPLVLRNVTELASGYTRNAPSWFPFLFPVFLIVCQLRIANVGSFDVPFAVAGLSFGVISLLDLRRTKGATLGLLNIILCVVAVKALPETFSEQTVLVPNANSAALFVVCFAFGSLFATVPIRAMNHDVWNNKVRITLYILFVVLVVQHYLVNVAGYESFLTPFGDYIILGKPNPNRFLGEFGYRCAATFIEPSFAALVLFSLATMLTFQRITRVDMFVLAICVLLVRSVLGFVLIAAIILFDIMLGKRVRWTYVALSCFGLLVGAMLLLYFAPMRISEIYIEGTSGYYRTTFPLRVVFNSFSTYPVGIPFGALEQYIASFHVMNGGQPGTSLDNGLAVFIVYFGLLAAAAIAAGIGWFFRAGVHASGAKLAFAIVGMSQFTGGILMFGFWFLVCMVIYSARLSMLPRGARRVLPAMSRQ